MWRKFAEAILKVYLTGGCIVSLIMAFFMGSEEESILLFLIVLIAMVAVIFLSAMTLGMFVDALRYLEEIANNTKNLGNYSTMAASPKNISQSIPQNAKDSKLDLSAVANESSTKDDGWICQKCACKNPVNAVFCKSCGEHK